eukprot:297677_1
MAALAAAPVDPDRVDAPQIGACPIGKVNCIWYKIQTLPKAEEGWSEGEVIPARVETEMIVQVKHCVAKEGTKIIVRNSAGEEVQSYTSTSKGGRTWKDKWNNVFFRLRDINYDIRDNYYEKDDPKYSIYIERVTSTQVNQSKPKQSKHCQRHT